MSQKGRYGHSLFEAHCKGTSSFFHGIEEGVRLRGTQGILGFYRYGLLKGICRSLDQVKGKS